MFWRMTGLSTASPVETILDKHNFNLEELLGEDEIIQECKALNARLINFLTERRQVEQLVRYIVEEAPEDAEKSRSFKFPFISCEIFTCEVDDILKTLVEDEELLALLFSFLDPNRPHSTLLAGYFNKVMICLLLRKTAPIMKYIQAHQEIIKQMVDLIGITSIMEVLVRLIGADEHIYANYAEAISWLEDTDVLEMIMDKFVSSDYPEWHANAAEALCAIVRYAPSGLATKVLSPSFVGRLLHHALDESRPKSVLVQSLSVCICLLDPKRVTLGSYHMYNHQYTAGSSVTASPETVYGMLESLDQLLKLLVVSSDGSVLPTTFGKLQPPLGKHRLKIVEFIAVLLSIGNEAAEKELIKLGAVQQVLDLFFEYPYNNFLHHQAESIILCCLESRCSFLVEHILRDCKLVQKMLEAEKNFTLSHDPEKPTVPVEGKQPPRIGNIGHLTRICNKLVHVGNSSSKIHTLLQENDEWVNWSSTVLSKRNAIENIHQWACGRPSKLHDPGRDSDDEDYHDRDYDVAKLANNLSQAFRYGVYTNEMDEVQESLDRDDEDVYFDDESAEVVLSSLRLGDDQESSSLFTNSNWFALEDKRTNNDGLIGALASASPEGGDGDDVDKAEDEVGTASSSAVPETSPEHQPKAETCSNDAKPMDDSAETDNKTPVEWVEWREASSSTGVSEPDNKHPLSNGACEEQSKSKAGDRTAQPDEGISRQQSTDQENPSSEVPSEVELQKQI